jgi:predicted small lipoprotein YifL
MRCWANSLFITVVIALGCFSVLNACGQKGPLTLPDTASHPPPPGADVPAPIPPPAAPLR